MFINNIENKWILITYKLYIVLYVIKLNIIIFIFFFVKSNKNILFNFRMVFVIFCASKRKKEKREKN